MGRLILLTDTGVLTLTGAGYSLAIPDTGTVDKHMAMSIHHPRAGRLAEAREEAQKSEQSREGKSRSGFIRPVVSAIRIYPEAPGR